MTVDSIDQLNQKYSSNLTVEELSNGMNYPIKATTLDAIFDNNSLSQKLPEIKEEKASFFKILKNFLKLSKTKEITPVKDKDNEVGAIDFRPTLEMPDHLPLNLKGFKLPKITEPVSNLTDSQHFEILSNLSDQSMHKIMAIVLTRQGELAQEGALISMDEFEQFQKMQSFQQKVLKEIKEALLKDEYIKGILKNIQNISAVAAVAASVSVFLGVTAPIAVAATAVSAISGALAAGGKSYYATRASEDEAKFEDLSHKMRTSQRYQSDTVERMEELAQDNSSEKILSKMFKDLLKMIQSIIHK